MNKIQINQCRQRAHQPLRSGTILIVVKTRTGGVTTDHEHPELKQLGLRAIVVPGLLVVDLVEADRAENQVAAVAPDETITIVGEVTPALPYTTACQYLIPKLPSCLKLLIPIQYESFPCLGLNKSVVT